ncbi:hypothetical protein D5I55_08170 [Chakrabartia godavariana]|nr:hypothetical protein D5I55_08170 [Chakrabartia godavariana]
MRLQVIDWYRNVDGQQYDPMLSAQFCLKPVICNTSLELTVFTMKKWNVLRMLLALVLESDPKFGIVAI